MRDDAVPVPPLCVLTPKSRVSGLTAVEMVTAGGGHADALWCFPTACHTEDGLFHPRSKWCGVLRNVSN